MVLRVKHGAMLDQLSLCCSPSQAHWRGPDAHTPSRSITAYSNIDPGRISVQLQDLCMKANSTITEDKAPLLFSKEQHSEFANMSRPLFFPPNSFLFIFFTVLV